MNLNGCSYRIMIPSLNGKIFSEMYLCELTGKIGKSNCRQCNLTEEQKSNLFLERYMEDGIEDKMEETVNSCTKLLEELQQYKAIGTVEECKEAMKKQKSEVPDIWGDAYDNDGNIIYDMYTCPNCGKSYEIDYSDYNYCSECGQRLDLSDIC